MEQFDAETLIRKRLPRHAERLIPLLRDAAEILTELADDDSIPVGESKFGGMPDMPPSIAWPHRSGRPLSFLCQISCGQVLQVAPRLRLPPSGLILVFYDIQEQPWGFDPSDRDGTSVVYIESPLPLHRASIPHGLDKELILPSAVMEFVPSLDLPDSYDTPLENVEFTDDECDALIDLVPRCFMWIWLGRVVG